MKKVPTLVRREFSAYFLSPIAYVVFAVFLTISGYFFYAILINLQEASLRYILANMSITMLFLSPMITMRLLAEEKRSGTIETLMTDPVTDWEVVLSKFLAAIGFFLALLAPTYLYIAILQMIGNPDMGPIITGYLGLILLGALFLSFGLLASALTKNQIVAASISFSVLLIFWILGWVADVSPGVLGKVIGYLAFFDHFDSFRKGVIDTKDIIYYLSSTFLCLFLTVRVVEARKWR